MCKKIKRREHKLSFKAIKKISILKQSFQAMLHWEFFCEKSRSLIKPVIIFIDLFFFSFLFLILTFLFSFVSEFSVFDFFLYLFISFTFHLPTITLYLCFYVIDNELIPRNICYKSFDRSIPIKPQKIIDDSIDRKFSQQNVIAINYPRQNYSDNILFFLSKIHYGEIKKIWVFSRMLCHLERIVCMHWFEVIYLFYFLQPRYRLLWLLVLDRRYIFLLIFLYIFELHRECLRFNYLETFDYRILLFLFGLVNKEEQKIRVIILTILELLWL